MAEYKLNIDGGVVRNEVFIPEDEGNRDYKQYLDWLAAGNTPDPADQAPAIALTVSPSQQIILADGLDLATVTFRGDPGATVNYTVNGQAQSLTLDDTGVDVLELTCDTPNTTLLVQVGSARAVIFAVEVPA